MQPDRLLQLVNDLAIARDVPTVTGLVRSAARELTGADGVTVVLREHDMCYYADEEAIAPLWKGRRFPVEHCISGWAMEHATTVVLPDIYVDARIPHDAYRPTFVKSLAMVPVPMPNPIAAIGAYWATHHRATARELELMTALADHTGLALTNVETIENLRASIEREREARVAAEQAAVAKDEFLALVAHELRQPLHVSLAALRMMQMRAGREAGERARDMVGRQLHLMNRLVEDLLDAARVVRGHVDLQLQPVDVAAGLRQAAEAAEPVMAEGNNPLDLDVPAEPILVEADEHRLQQVFMNLLTNAAKYTDAGGHVRLSARAEGSEAVITVADTGRGIPPEALSRVFDLFMRGERETEGFGVGLAVTRRLVELHGGRIEASSDGPGRGSEFIVRLPLAAERPERSGT
jgi:signal transduction histidine kinase